VPAYGQIPKELTQDKEKAKEFLDKAGVAGVVVMRVVGKDQEISSTPANYYAMPYYASHPHLLLELLLLMLSVPCSSPMIPKPMTLAEVEVP